MCMCVCVLVHVCVCRWVYVYSVYICIYISSCVLVAWYSVSDSFGEIQTCYRRFGLMFVMNPIHWWFKDWSMGWSVDQHLFVQWRPDGDSVPKSRHFMWMFILVYLPLSVCIYMLLLSFHVTFYYILPVWLLISLLETSVIVRLIYIVDMSLYSHHFMCY